MPAETVAGSFPFVYSGLNDGNGVLLGKDSAGGIVLIDIWLRLYRIIFLNQLQRRDH